MKAIALFTAIGLALAIPTTSIAADSAEQSASARVGKIVGGASTRAVNNQAAVSCNYCFTCGGDWPTFSGYTRSNPATVFERGSACSGALASRTDSSPYLCCN